MPCDGLAGLADRGVPAEVGRLDVLRASAGIGDGLEEAGGSGVYCKELQHVPFP